MDPAPTGGLYFEVMSHSQKFADVTTDDGAARFNQEFLITTSTVTDPEEKAERETPVTVEIIDAVVRKETLLAVGDGIGTKEHVEYIIKLTRGQLLKTVGKRYSELQAFHNLLIEHRLIDRLTAPPFPEKQTFRDGWYKFDHTDTNSDFVRSRKVALDAYLKKLFEANPTLYHEPCAIAFFGIEEFELKAAEEVSAKAAAAATAEKNPIAPLQPTVQPNMSGLYDV
mmetsp:Transcript_23438/g.30432  ORF Transcript_23438/g.30432 Transcript_23438/m.30432 type:complete len:226 (+) Transcript_23438:69-746(+)